MIYFARKFLFSFQYFRPQCKSILISLIFLLVLFVTHVACKNNELPILGTEEVMIETKWIRFFFHEKEKGPSFCSTSVTVLHESHEYEIQNGWVFKTLEAK